MQKTNGINSNPNNRNDRTNRDLKSKPKKSKTRLKFTSALLFLSMVVGGVSTYTINNKFSDKDVHVIDLIDTVNDEHNCKVPIEYEGETYYISEDSSAFSLEDIEEGKNNIYVFSDDGTLQEVQIESQYLKKLLTISEANFKNYEKVYRVNSEDGANLRNDPDTSDDKNILKTLKYGEYVLGSKSKDYPQWINCLYSNGSTTNIGCIRSDLLKELSEINFFDSKEEQNSKTEKESETTAEENEILKNITTNSSGTVTGIDVSSIPIDKLEEVLSSEGITDSTLVRDISSPDESSSYSVNTADLNGKINYVYIKVGASLYGNESNFEQFETPDFVKRAEICEKLKIPYGFYFYSTSINEDEGKKEADFVKNSISKIKNENNKYNVLPLAIDVELASDGDRQANNDVTDAKICFSNKLNKNGIKTILYTGGRMCSNSSSEKIIDLEKYFSQTSDLGLWLATSRYASGEMTERHQDYYNEFKDEILLTQVVLDAKDLEADINETTKDSLAKLINSKENKKEESIFSYLEL